MRYLIVGASAAGIAAAEGIRRRDASGEILIVSDEPAYYRPLLAQLLDGTRSGSQVEREPGSLPADVKLLIGRRVARLDISGASVSLDGGQVIGYDKILLATGSRAIRPPVPGVEADGVFTLRRWDDALGIARAARDARRAVVLGAGRVGIKCAFALRHLGLAVTVVEMEERIVPQQLDAVAAEIFTPAVREAGIELRTRDTVVAVDAPKGWAAGVALKDGRELAAELVILAVGVAANVDLAAQAGLEVGRGVRVDEHLATSVPSVYAAGDAVETQDRVTGRLIVSGIWTNAVEMGHVAGENMAGGERRYPGAFGLLNAMEMAGLPVISVGEIQASAGDGCEILARRVGSTYRKLVLRDGRLVGFILVGDVERAGVYQALIREQVDVAAFKDQVASPRFGYAHFVRQQPALADRYLGA